MKAIIEYIKHFIKWIIVAGVVGVIGGLVGSFFHKCLDLATELRGEHAWIIFLLPIAGVLIAAMYQAFRSKGKIDTNCVIEAVQADENVPLIMSPLIFISTVITQLFGGSAGRVGASLQIGGSIGYNIGRCFRLKQSDLHIIVMAGMSSVFASLFGTPLTAAVFALEVISVGFVRYGGFMPCIISSVVAYLTAVRIGVSPVRFDTLVFDSVSAEIMIKAIILSVLCALVSIVFCVLIKKCEFYMKKFFGNVYLRAFVGGLVIVVLTIALNTTDYNGAGMEVVARAMQGEAKPEAFILKIIFTAITISAGFKGGEIAPTLFIGSTFGCVVGELLGLDAAFGAAIGFVALFCGVVNCPLASVMLALEVFGADAILVFAVVCGISFVMSGYFGLYKSQRFTCSKHTDECIDINAK